jgi:glutamine synthetase
MVAVQNGPFDRTRALWDNMRGGSRTGKESYARTPLLDTYQDEANLRQAERYLPDNIYTALADFRNATWTTKLLGEDVKARYADLKQAAADRCPRLLGTFVKVPEVQYHHDVYNQYLWNFF